MVVQAVLPAGTTTDLYETAGMSIESLGRVLTVGQLVDAALAGLTGVKRSAAFTTRL